MPMIDLGRAYTERERKLVNAAIAIRSELCKEDEFDWQKEIDLLNDALELYGYGRVKQQVR